MAPTPFLDWASCPLPVPGLLPNWMLVYALFTLAMGVLACVFPKAAARRYIEPDLLITTRLTPQAVRALGFFVILSAVTRINAASSPTDYSTANCALFSYAVELVYLLSEFFVYRSLWVSPKFVCLTLLTAITMIWLRMMQPYSVRYDMYRWATACRGFEGTRDEYRTFLMTEAAGGL